jgi:hypothetical protein
VVAMWYKRCEEIYQVFSEVRQMEAAELKSAISELQARIVKIRDWL